MSKKQSYTTTQHNIPVLVLSKIRLYQVSFSEKASLIALNK